MKTVSLDEIRVAGVLDRDQTDAGVVFRRLPGWTRHQITDVQLALMVTMPAGVRLELDTDSSELELDVMLTLLQIGDRPLKSAAFDLVVDGELVTSVKTDLGTRILYDAFTGDVEFQAGEPVTIRFADVASNATASVEIWLPQDCVVEIRDLRVADEAAVAAPSVTRRRWVHHGSSISHCLEADQPTATWPALAARRAGVDLQNLAFAGQCMLDPMVARTIRDLEADVISIKAGINIVNGDTMRERTLVAAIHGFLDTVRDGHPTTPIALVTPIICPMVEDHPGPTLLGRDERFHVVPRAQELATGAVSLQLVRSLFGDVVAARRGEGDTNLHLVDGLALFGPDDVEDLPDGLHPNPAGYRRIGERFHDLLFANGGAFSDDPNAESRIRSLTP